MSWTGKVALVTGAASGIGEATARRLAEHGASVILADMDVANGERVAGELGAPHRFGLLDVADEQAWSGLLGSVVSEFGGIDFLYLNAGVMSRPGTAPLAEDTLDWLGIDIYRRVMNINVLGVHAGIVAALPHLQARGGGAIMVTASGAGVAPLAFDPIYAMSKHAVVGLTRSLAPALAPLSITLNAVCPASTNTNMNAGRRTQLEPDGPAVSTFSGLPMLSPRSVADAVISIAQAGGSGEVWTVDIGREPRVFQFTALES